MRTEFQTIKITIEKDIAILTIDNPRSIPCPPN